MQKTLSVVNLSAILSNARLVRSLIGNRFFWAVVKADAYGHGAEEVARELEDVADGFCVAIAEEGVALRASGISKPILVLAPPREREDAERMKFYNLLPTVTDEVSAELVAGSLCHVAVNTGMNRYGCYGEELENVLKILPKDTVVGAYSHLYAAGNAVHSKRQLSFFKAESAKIKAHSPQANLHISASGGILRGGEYLMDGVRCGIMLYGYAPKGFKCKGLMPALKVYARLVQRTKPVGGGVGYNIATEKYGGLYTYRLGYADGFFRGVPLGEKTLCMDAFVSKKYDSLLPVMENADVYAERAGTISYEALCSVTRRSQRIYERPTEI